MTTNELSQGWKDHERSVDDWNRAMDDRRDAGRKYGTNSRQYRDADAKVKSTGTKSEGLLKRLTRKSK